MGRRVGLWTTISAALALGLLLFAPTVWGIGVRPLVIDVQPKPGEAVPFTMTLTPSGKEEDVKVTFYRIQQQPTGELSYLPADETNEPLVKWVKLSSTSAHVPADQEVKLDGQVVAPLGSSGSHTLVLMLDSSSTTQQNGVGVRVRYAVRLHVDVQSNSARLELKLNNWSLDKSPDQLPMLTASITNPTTLDYTVDQAEVVLRDAKGRLVDRRLLLTNQSRLTGNESIRIYPGATLQLSDVIVESLPPGQYSANLTVRYAGGKQLVEQKQFSVTDGEFATNAATFVRIEPAPLEFHGVPGRTDTQTLNITNRTGEPLTVMAYARDVKQSYERSIWPRIHVLSQLPIQVQPQATGRLILSAESLSSDQPGGLYGLLVLRETDAAGKVVSQQALTIGFKIGKSAPALRVSTAEYQPPASSSQRGLLRIGIENTGAVDAPLIGSVRVETSTGTLMGEADLAAAQGQGSVLPGLTGEMAAQIPGLSPGAYKAVVHLVDVDKTVLVDAAVVDFAVKATSG